MWRSEFKNYRYDSDTYQTQWYLCGNNTFKSKILKRKLLWIWKHFSIVITLNKVFQNVLTCSIQGCQIGLQVADWPILKWARLLKFSLGLLATLFWLLSKQFRGRILKHLSSTYLSVLHVTLAKTISITKTVYSKHCKVQLGPNWRLKF